MKTVQEIKEHINFLNKQINWYKGKGGKLLTQKRALARPSDSDNQDYDKSPEQIVQESQELINKLEVDLMSAQFREGQSTYRVNYQKSVLGMFQMGSVLVQAHTAELALSQVDGAVSVSLHQEGGIKDLQNQISALAEWI
jgi:hypothetical protein